MGFCCKLLLSGLVVVIRMQWKIMLCVIVWLFVWKLEQWIFYSWNIYRILSWYLSVLCCRLVFFLLKGKCCMDKVIGRFLLQLLILLIWFMMVGKILRIGILRKIFRLMMILLMRMFFYLSLKLIIIGGCVIVIGS